MPAKRAPSGSGRRPKVTIKIPRELYERIQRVIRGTGFGSVTEFIVYVLRDLVAVEGGPERAGLSRREIDLIRTRLQNLGYLD